MHHHPSTSREPGTVRQAGIWRSRVLTALMRYPLPDLLGQLLRAARAGRPGWRGLAGALPRVPAAVRRRRVLPRSVMAGVRELSR